MIPVRAFLAAVTACSLARCAAFNAPEVEDTFCDLRPFAPFQAINGTAQACATCLFPTYPYINSLDLSAYPSMDFTDRWIYFLGDVTVRQIYGEFAAIVHRAQVGKNVGAAPHHSQHDCTNQTGRRLGYQPPPFDHTPCYLNERTCSRQYSHTRMGRNVTLTYDWKHFMYEDYDRALFNSWEKEGGPDFLVLSPGAHDCYHDPQDYRHHALQLKRLAQHLHGLPVKVIWFDTNPMTYAAHGGPALDCNLHVNAAAHEEAKALGFYMFSRQTMIMSAEQVDENGHYPMHQPDSVVKAEVDLMLSWLSCIEGSAV